MRFFWKNVSVDCYKSTNSIQLQMHLLGVNLFLQMRWSHWYELFVQIIVAMNRPHRLSVGWMADYCRCGNDIENALMMIAGGGVCVWRWSVILRRQKLIIYICLIVYSFILSCFFVEQLKIEFIFSVYKTQKVKIYGLK